MNALAKPKPDIGKIAAAIDCLFGKDDIIEIRALHTQGRARTDAGYFDGANRRQLAAAAEKLSESGAAVYVAMNPLNPQLLARYTNRVQDFAGKTAADANVTRRRWLLLDFDPTRPPDTSATDAQLDAAKACATRCWKALKEKGWPKPTVAMSGNGYHLLFPINLPNDDESRDLIKGVLSGLAARFDNELVTVDQSVYNAGRIIKLYGTIANKGDHAPDYPWRLSSLENAPGRDKVVTPEQLLEWKPANSSMNGASVHRPAIFNLEEFLSRLKIDYTQDIHEGSDRFKLDHCPFNAEHGKGEAAIFRKPSGKLGFKCQHNSCADKRWQDVRALVDRPRDARAKEKEQPTAATENQPTAATEKRKSLATRLIEIAASVDLFHDTDGKCYTTLDINGHKETWPIRSKGFRDWLCRQFYLAERRAPNSSSLQDALMTIDGQARYDGQERPVHLRVASHNKRIYIDLCNAQWRAIEITQDGWQVVDSPVRFIRAPGMKALPAPVPGDIDLLFKYLNVAKADRCLILAWLVAAMRPTGPYPVLILQGEQGTAKSTAAKVLRALIDPSAVLLRTMPRDERDLMIAARNGWVIALDNLSGLSPWLSDALCRIATGGGFATRELYSDTDEVLIDVQRPIILNGIDDIATRQDLIDRSIIINLEPIPEHKRKPEAEFWRAFEKDKPALLGALLDRVSRALRELPNTHLKSLPRMADFALWTTAAEPESEREKVSFVTAYRANRQSAIESGLDGSPVATVLRDIMNHQQELEGTATELLKELNSHSDERTRQIRSWPKSPKALGSQLRRLATALRAVGVCIEHEREPGTGQRTIKVCKHSSQTSQTSQNQVKPCEINNLSVTQRDASVTQHSTCDASCDANENRKSLKTKDCDISDVCDAKIQPFSNNGAKIWNKPTFEVIPNPPDAPWQGQYPPNSTTLDGAVLAESF